MKMLIRLFFLLTLSLFLHANDIKSTVFVYNCTNNYHFVAELKKDEAWLFLPLKTLKVDKVESNSETIYTSDNTVFSYNGHKATLRVDKEHYSCQNDGITATFEKAKLDGVAFRGIGNEPGWVLEITSDKEVVLITNLGENTTTFEVTEKYLGTHATEYKMKSIHNTLFVRIENRECKDTMVDKTYESTVYINFDGINMQGCGKSLY